MDKNKLQNKALKIEKIKQEIITLRIKNRYYDQKDVMDKLVDELISKQFIDAKEQSKNKKL